LKEVTAQELKALDPRRFKKEYESWMEYQPYHDWAEWLTDDFKAEMKCEGIHVDNFYWDISYSQGDGANFDGYIQISEWMEANPQYAEQYQALYLACEQDGSYITVRTGNRGHNMHFNFNESWWGTEPCGIFHLLDKDTWCELVEDQASSASIEDEIRSTCERFMKDLYYKLRDEYENLTSEDAFVESCECNGVTFEVECEDDHVAA
jgi:hypothetical protein